MPASLSALVAKTATIPISIDGDMDAITVTYRKFAYSEDVERLVVAAQADQAPAKAVRSVFMEVIQAWDLTFAAEDTEPIPLTAEGLSAVPTEALGEILRQVGEHKEETVGPKAKTANGSRPR